MLLLHNQEQERQLAKVLIHKLYSSIYKNLRLTQNQRSEEIEGILSGEMNNTCFIPVTDKNPADSSNAWTTIIREQVGVSDCFYDMDKIPLLLALKKNYIIFYDDKKDTDYNYKIEYRFEVKGNKIYWLYGNGEGMFDFPNPI